MLTKTLIFPASFHHEGNHYIECIVVLIKNNLDIVEFCLGSYRLIMSTILERIAIAISGEAGSKSMFLILESISGLKGCHT